MMRPTSLPRRSLFCLLLAAVVLSCATQALPREEKKKAGGPAKVGVIIALGAGHELEARPGPLMAQRVWTAVKAYREKRAEVILFCGGYTSGHVAEAEEMAVMAMALGVPRRAILVENASISTSQNAAFAEPLLKKRGFRSALLVTHKEHMDRAFKEFKEIKQLRRLERGYADDAVPDPLSVEFDRALPAADQFQAVVLHTRSGWLEPGADPLVLQGPQVEVAKGAAFLYRSGLTAVPYFVWHDAFAVGHVTRAEMVGLAAIAYGMPASALEYASARRYSKEGLELFDTCLARGWKSVLAVIPAERAGDVADIERQYLEHGISAFVLVVK